ncbi:hypothetical protein WKW79_05255 [Variovorax robiniae]|uniref:Small-conductance mechanosensitive channel n=1 Tax=Variovorax robiniae TaxID=1836199 RepID=A0ABU8X2D6_9BURK
MNQFDISLEPLRAFLFQIGAYLPRLFFAAVVIVAGWLIAKVVRFAVTKGLRAANFGVLTQRSGMDNFLKQGGLNKDTSDLIGLLAYGMVLLAALIIAFNGLGLTYITDLLGRVMWFVPNVFVAMMVLAFGSYFAKFVGDAVIHYGRGNKLADAVFFGKVVRYAIMIFVVLIALDHVKVGGDIVRESFLVILAGVVFALALAFGLAGKDWAADRISQWWPQGDRVVPPAPTTTPKRDVPVQAAEDAFEAPSPVPEQATATSHVTTLRPRGRPLIQSRPADPPPPL